MDSDTDAATAAQSGTRGRRSAASNRVCVSTIQLGAGQGGFASNDWYSNGHVYGWIQEGWAGRPLFLTLLLRSLTAGSSFLHSHHASTLRCLPEGACRGGSFLHCMRLQ